MLLSNSFEDIGTVVELNKICVGIVTEDVTFELLSNTLKCVAIEVCVGDNCGYTVKGMAG